MVPPGSVGFLVSNGGFATFEECVAANRALPPSEFEFSGGKLGVWLQDSPYSDNLAGLDERTPKCTSQTNHPIVELRPLRAILPAEDRG